MSQTLRNLSHTPLFRRTRPEGAEALAAEDPVAAEVVEEGLVVGESASEEVGADNVLGQANQVTMVNYDSETAEDVGEALQAACRSLKGYEFEQSDLDFYFNQVELQMRTNGVKKNYTKFLVLSSILDDQDKTKNNF